MHSSAPAAPRRKALSPTRLVAFVVLDVLLLAAIPLMATRGYTTLLRSTDGNFLYAPGQDDPGWSALVDPTPISAVVEMYKGSVAGVAIVVGEPGTVILIPSTLLVDGVTLAERSPEEAVTAVSEALRLGVMNILVMNQAAWQRTLGTTEYEIDNPDPVRGPGQASMFKVGPVAIGADEVAAFLAEPVDGGGPITSMPRRQLFWSALVENPPVRVSEEQPAPGGAQSRESLSEILVNFEPGAQVLTVPTTAKAEPVLLESATETMIRDVVAYPTSPPSGSRLRVEIVDRTGTADLQAIASVIAAAGVEVPSIANADPLDSGPTELIVPSFLDPKVETSADPRLLADLIELSASLGTATVVGAESIDEVDGGGTVTLLIGPDFDFTDNP